MKTIYTILIVLYNFLAGVASLFSDKAHKWVKGRKGWHKAVSSFKSDGSRVLWMHCASLGEFEQGRPVIETIKKEIPGWKVIITFFSPSGYEIRKNYSGADLVMYLPADLPVNVRYFLDKAKPDLVLIVKYEFWYNYLSELNKRKINTYLVSGIFRPSQYFFRWYGWFARRMLSVFTHIFVQDEQSGRLLSSIGFNRFTITGDTRFDRVSQIAESAEELPLIKLFKGEERLFVAGSSWDADEEIITAYINYNAGAMKWIIVPHEIDEPHLERIEAKLKTTSCRYSALKENNCDNRVLIIDNIGMLSSLYQYATIASVGGGFGKGIHNILEPASWGIPVLFGPNYHKFREADDLIHSGGAISFNNSATFSAAVEKYLLNNEELKSAGLACGTYVAKNKGATNKVFNEIFK